MTAEALSPEAFDALIDARCTAVEVADEVAIGSGDDYRRVWQISHAVACALLDIGEYVATDNVFATHTGENA